MVWFRVVPTKCFVFVGKSPQKSWQKKPCIASWLKKKSWTIHGLKRMMTGGTQFFRKPRSVQNGQNLTWLILMVVHTLMDSFQWAATVRWIFTTVPFFGLWKIQRPPFTRDPVIQCTLKRNFSCGFFADDKWWQWSLIPEFSKRPFNLGCPNEYDAEKDQRRWNWSNYINYDPLNC